MKSTFQPGDRVRLIDDRASVTKRKPPFGTDVALRVLRVSPVSGCLVIAGYPGFWKPERFEVAS
ncbi:MAG: hypothetical protein JF588_19305 [Caulobacterales bacterium]|nr:hypothetical protein [Caulobacterales bacterium]